MQPQVLLDHVVGHMTRCCHEISPKPKYADSRMDCSSARTPSSPQATIDILHHLVARHSSLLGHLAGNITARHVQPQPLDAVGPAALRNPFPQVNPNLPVRHRFAVIGRPHKGVLDRESAMCRSAVLLHPTQDTCSMFFPTARDSGPSLRWTMIREPFLV